MVRTLLKTSLREIRQSLGRYLAILAIVGLGVGFFAGLRTCQPAMLATGIDYIGEHRLFDFRMLSTLGFTRDDVGAFAALGGVEAARGSVYTDFLTITGDDEVEYVLRAHSLTADINLPSLVAGRMPEAPNECLADAKRFTEADLGRVLRVLDDNDEDTRELLHCGEYTIVGIIDAPYYLNYERGTSSLGSGSVYAFVYIPEDGFDFEAYYEIFLALEVPADAYSDAYQDQTDGIKAEVERLTDERAELRYTTLYNDALEEIQDGEKEVADGWDTYYTEQEDAEQELQDAYQKLLDGEQEYQDGLADYEQGRRDYADGLAKYEDGLAELADAKRELDDAEAQFADAKRELDDAEAELADAKRELDDAEVQFADYERELEDAAAELADAKQELDDAEAQFADAKRELDDAEAELVDAKQELDDAEAQFADYKRELDDAAAELADAKRELDDAEAQFADYKRKLDDAAAEFAYAGRELDAADRLLRESKAVLDRTKAELDQGWAAYNAELGQLTDLAGSTGMSLEELAASSAEIAGALQQLNILKAQLEEGNAQYSAGMKQYEAGCADYQAGLDAYNKGYADYQAGLKEYKKNYADYQAGLEEYNKGYADYQAGLEEYNKGYADYQAGLEKYNEGYADYQAGLEEYNKGYADYQAGLEKYNEGYADYQAGLEEYSEGYADYQAGLEKYNEGYADYQAGLDEYNENYADYEQGLADYEQGLLEMEDARRELDDAKEELDRAPGELADARKELDDGWAEYNDGRAEADSEFADAEKELLDAEQELADAREKLADLKPASTYVLTRAENTGYVCFDNDTSIIAAISVVFPVFFFLVAALVCMTTMTRMVDEQRTQIGVLKALGYSNGQIMGKYLAYSGSAAIIGGAAGYALGTAGLPRIFWEIYGIIYGFAPLRQVFLPGLLAVSLAAALLCSMGATWLACRVELTKQSAELLRPRTPKAGRRVFLEYITPLWRRLSFLHKVSVRNVLRYRSRLIMMVLGIGGCTALLATGFGIQDSIRHIGDDQYGEITLYDYSVTFQDDQTPESAAAYLERHGWAEDAALLVHSGSVDVVANGESKSVYRIMSSTDSLEGFVDLHSGDTPIRYPGPGEVVLNMGLAQNMGIALGDTVELRDSELGSLTATVSGIADNYAFNYAYISAETCQQQLGQVPAYNTLYLNSSGEADPYAEGADLLDDDDVGNVTVIQSSREQINNLLSRLDYVVVVVVVCAAALAFIVLYNLTNINITERIREIATIKVLGFYQNEVASYVLREIMILSVLGSLAGLLMGKALHTYVMSMIRIDAMFFACRIVPSSYFLSFGMTMVFAAGISLGMRPRLTRIDMAESLKSIE